jgi:hypothetical protein
VRLQDLSRRLTSAWGLVTAPQPVLVLDRENKEDNNEGQVR